MKISKSNKIKRNTAPFGDDDDDENGPGYPINLWIDMISVADYSYYKFFNELSAWYQIEGLPTKDQVTHLVETYIAHVVNGVLPIYL